MGIYVKRTLGAAILYRLYYMEVVGKAMAWGLECVGIIIGLKPLTIFMFRFVTYWAAWTDLAWASKLQRWSRTAKDVRGCEADSLYILSGLFESGINFCEGYKIP